MNLKNILKVFEITLGLKVNGEKSCIASIHVDELELNSLASLLGCKVEKWPLKYLGIPLGGSSRLANFWNPVVEKVEKKKISLLEEISNLIGGSDYLN